MSYSIVFFDEGTFRLATLLLLLLLLLKKIGSARLRESDVHPISMKSPAPQYQPIDRKKRKRKRVEGIQRTATDQRREMSHSNTPPVRNWAPLTARSSSLRCVSAAEHQTVEQYSKTGRTKPKSISQEAIYHGTLARAFY